MYEQMFWAAATVACVLAFTFAFKYKGMVPAQGAPRRVDLAKGQEKDDWLICVAIWAVVLSGNHEWKNALESVGAAALAWAAWRTYRRLSVLRQS